jgi:hypothetical protein
MIIIVMKTISSMKKAFNGTIEKKHSSMRIS